MRIGIEKTNGRRELVIRRGQAIEREIMQPLEGTRMSLSNSQIPAFWQETYGAWYGTPQLTERVWVASRCKQLNAQQIASMPLEFHGGDDEPTWVSNPDPTWFPNGIGDALHAIVDQVYGWGFALLFITDFYADGFPRTWTVLDSAKVSIKAENGRRVYTVGGAEGDEIPARRVVQIDRNPGVGLHGTSALRAYAQAAYGLLAAGNRSQSVNDGGIPDALIKANAILQPGQAEQIQERWINPRFPGAPRVIGKDLEYQQLSFNPEDLALLDTQEFNARAIASAFGVPAMLLNMPVTGGLTYQNPAALGEMWWRFELRPTATRIANAFSAQMLPRGQWVTFDAADTFAEITDLSDDDDPQLSQVAKASPSQQPNRLSVAAGG